ncbi:aminotransferase class III-fold pyridoxal phosphate-dependent enzyme [Mesorhizobium sp. BAC0120]|uniref:aspartate aminotransferase family protein n=1 Tax=Mesorhizobium sp. BAC0120 TaxID=3090670 RepID=UPI00298BEF22|nr:aminotransferase class III-fold pyridoxal phosphate-dependent enzyme [Mesorhizobium sp. BAC0120]MDW6021421.1 aminotransferase class III-fold pyridoxal phosphate-dependent enzyme [Mesorhizobium sp. BAC0120]
MSAIRATNDFIGAELALAEERYARRNPTSGKHFERAARSMPGGNTRSALHFDPFPLYVASSSGATITDADGHHYLDALGEFTAGIYGHRNAVIIQAIEDVLARGFSNGAPSEAEIRLAELMCERFPSVEAIRFCNSGTEATLYALTLAKVATRRNGILAFSAAYHGGTFVFADGGSLMNVPFDWSIARYNDETSVREIFAERADTLAAVIVEPVMSNGGCIPAAPEFLALLRTLCDAHGVQLIFDEIVTSRMGYGGVQAITGVIPDLTTFGKYVGAGFSSGAFGGRRELMELMDPTRPGSLPHAGTFNNNLFSMTAGAAALEKEFTRERADVLFAEGEELRTRLNAALLRAAVPAQFTGMGSIMNIHFVQRPIRRPEDTHGADKRLLALLHLDLMERGVFIARRGQINLSLPMVKADLDRIVEAVSDFAHHRKALIEAVPTVSE